MPLRGCCGFNMIIDAHEIIFFVCRANVPECILIWTICKVMLNTVYAMKGVAGEGVSLTANYLKGLLDSPINRICLSWLGAIHMSQRD